MTLHKLSQRGSIGVWIVFILVIGGVIFAAARFSAPPSVDLPGDATLGTVPTLNPQGNILGQATAPVSVIKYSDFQCPACAAASPLVKDILNQYGDDVVFEYRHFPLTFHQNARPAAMAAEAAGLQGQFFAMHDKLFAAQSDWSGMTNPNRSFVEYAEELGLDVEQFEEDLRNRDLRQKVSDHFNEATAYGINATPTFAVNGTVVPGGVSEVPALIDAALAVDNALDQAMTDQAQPADSMEAMTDDGDENALPEDSDIDAS